MEATRTEIIHTKCGLYYFTHISKNIFNEFDYITRQKYFENSKIYRETKIKKNDVVPSETTLYNNVSPENNVLPKQTLQWIIKTFRTMWFSYFKALREYYKHPEDFLGKPNIPHYKDKDGEFILIFTNQQCHIENGILHFPKMINLEVKTRVDDNVNLREVRIIPHGNGYNIEIVYKKEINGPLIRNNNIMGIDVGVDNIVSISNNTGLNPVIVKGGVVKSINQFYNKQISKLRSINDIQNKHNKKYSRYTKMMKLITDKRNREINDLFHKLSIGVVNYALLNNIDTIVIGHNELWKQNVNMERRIIK
ncbi:RNA-guided endonuclease TnpB family protein, partial [Ferroplasma sp. Type II]|uniref:RNA-guided endonuclease InsQ/TnpB family protein n=1 Tax=Ferroplasma sp. Type II TaxID=261388 RepID=UPI0025C283DB